MLNDLEKVFPIDNLSIEDANTFYTFVFLHLHIYVQSAGAADLIVDLNRLATDQVHREDTEKCIASQDIAVDLSSAVNSITYSLCQLGSPADVRERLRVIGDIVIDRAPDMTGRSFGAKVLSDLIDEYDRHEFHAGVFRSVLLGSDGLLTERKGLSRERDAVRAERDGLRVERDAAFAERDAIRLERDSARSECVRWPPKTGQVAKRESRP